MKYLVVGILYMVSACGSGQAGRGLGGAASPRLLDSEPAVRPATRKISSHPAIKMRHLFAKQPSLSAQRFVDDYSDRNGRHYLRRNETLEVPDDVEVYATMEVSGVSPALVSWANNARVHLELGCEVDDRLPAGIESVICKEAGDSDAQVLTGHTQLQSLVIVSGQIARQSAANWAPLPKLVSLRLQRVSMADDGLASIVASTPALQYLEVSGSPVGSRGIQAISRLSDLRVLDLDSVRTFTSDHVASLAKLSTLRSLDLSFTRTDDNAGGSLAKLRSLRALWLTETEISDAITAQLALLPNLEYLDLSDTAITDEGVIGLTSLRKLRYLNVADTAVTSAGCVRLDKALGRSVCSRGD